VYVVLSIHLPTTQISTTVYCVDSDFGSSPNLCLNRVHQEPVTSSVASSPSSNQPGKPDWGGVSEIEADTTTASAGPLSATHAAPPGPSAV
jgi:hypothetical protein